jgi:hypothetical protein
MLARMGAAEEVIIETRRGPGDPVHRTVIWVIVDEAGRILVRTYLGPTTRWYREVIAHSECVVELGGERLSVRAVPALDPDRVAAASGGYLAKYAGHRAAAAMVAEGNLPTTMELVPR